MLFQHFFSLLYTSRLTCILRLSWPRPRSDNNSCLYNSFFHWFIRSVRKHETCFKSPFLSSLCVFSGGSAYDFPLGLPWRPFCSPQRPQDFFISSLALKLGIPVARHSRDKHLLWPQHAVPRELCPWRALAVSVQVPALSLLLANVSSKVTGIQDSSIAWFFLLMPNTFLLVWNLLGKLRLYLVFHLIRNNYWVPTKYRVLC